MSAMGMTLSPRASILAVLVAFVLGCGGGSSRDAGADAEDISSTFTPGHEWCGIVLDGGYDAGPLGTLSGQCFSTQAECLAAGFATCQAWSPWCFQVDSLDERVCFYGPMAREECFYFAMRTTPEAGSWSCSWANDHTQHCTIGQIANDQCP